MGGRGGPDQSAMMMSMLGIGSPVPPQGFGQYGQEQMRALLRSMMAKNPGDPLPFGLPPRSPGDMNNMLLASYGQNSALKPPGNKPPAARPNVQPLST